MVEQAWGDLPMLLSGDLTPGQYGARVGIQAAGSFVLGWASIALGKKIAKVFVLSRPEIIAVELVIGVGFSYLWEDWLEPAIYERRPNLYPKSQRVGPAEPLPW